MIDTRDSRVEGSMSMSAGEATRQLGRYRLLRHLATGGMAEIWLASIEERRRNDPAHAVIKVIAPERARDRQFVQMFLDEARVAATLHHQNIATLYEVGFENDTYFHAMEYVHGENVRAAIERSIIVRKPTPLAAAIVVARSIAAALHYAHERRGATGEPLDIVHRDVTPSNIMIGWDGAVKLVDFGVALAAGRAQQTRTGVVKGKLAYMSPEQCRGMKADRRTDVFALGVVLYELSLQKRAFRGDSEYQTMERIVRGDLMPPRQVKPDYPPALEQIVLRAMATDLKERYATAAEMGAALAEFAKSAGLAEGAAVGKEYMRGLFGEPPAPGDDAKGASVDVVSVRGRAPSAPPVPAELPAGTLDGTGDTRESPAAIAAAALAPNVASRVFAPTGPMPVVAKPGPTSAMDAQRPAVFAFGTQPIPPASLPGSTMAGSAVASGAAIASGVAARSDTSAVTVPEAPRSRVAWIVAAAVLVVGVGAAMAIILSSDGEKASTAPAAVAAPETGNRQPATGNRQPESAVAPVAVAPQAAPLVDTVTISITAEGSPAEISVDGNVVAPTPYDLVLPRGHERHKIEIRRSGFATFRKTITADASTSIKATLTPRGAKSVEAVEPPTDPPAGVDPGTASTNQDLSDERY
jgi:tRNA A-37 threonylcarbamoyl transferase component Bud32